MANRRLISIDLEGDTLPERVLGALDNQFISTVDLDNELSGLAPSATTVFSVNGVTPVDGNVTLPWSRPAGGIPESDLTAALQTKINEVRKPVGGWLKTDLETAVQSSLSKADTAVQPAGLTSYAPKASPAFTGTPTAPTAAAGTNTTQLATTAFVQASVNTGISGVQTSLADKADKTDPRFSDARTPLAHTHAISEVTGLQAALDAKAAAVHGHTIADVTGLQGALDGKAASSHTHTVADITATGTRGTTTFLRGDGAWMVPTNTTYAVMTALEADTGTATTARTVSAVRLREAIHQRVTGNAATPVTAMGQSLNRVADAAAARTLIGVPEAIKGDTGPEGPEGPMGPQGPQGEKGDKGDTGDGLELSGAVAEYADLPASAPVGSTWMVSSEGRLYTRTSTGWPPEGTGGLIQGPQGLQGPQGEVGPQGPKGDKGDKGDQGLQGIQGIQGTQGDKGDQGIQGIQGTQGPQGLSAYQVAQAGGFVGTQASWLTSLKGEKGDQGPQGLQGIQGIQGPQGDRGLKGEKGDKGDTGEQGIQGIQGLKGDTGNQGIQGIPGVKGDRGEPGLLWRGAYASGTAYAANDAVTLGGSSYRAKVASTGQSVTNSTYWELLASKGATGDQGPQGVQGEQGPQGLQGIQGIKGDTGDTGPAGTTTWAGITDKPSTFTPSAHSHPISEVTNLQGALDGKAAASHTHAVTDLTTTGTRSSTTYLRGDGTWATPTNTTYAVLTAAAAQAGTETTARTINASVLKGAIQHWVTGSSTASTTTLGKSLVTAADAASARGTLGAVSDSDSRLSDARTPTAHTHTTAQVTGLDAALASKLDQTQVDARVQLGVDAVLDSAPGTLDTLNELAAALGDDPNFATTVTNQIAGKADASHTHVASDVSDSTTVGRSVLTAASAAAARTAIGAGTSSLALGTTSSTAKAGDYQPTWAQVTGKPTTFPPAAHSHAITDVTGLQGALDAKVATTDSRLSDARTPTAHSHAWTEITGKPTTFTPTAHSHSWTEITSKPSTFTPSSHSHPISEVTGLDTALAGKVDTGDSRLSDARTPTAHTHAWTEITSKPTTFAPTIGSTSTTAVAGNDSRLTNARTPTAHTHPISDVTNLQTALNSKVVNMGGAGGLWIGTTATLPATGSLGTLYVTTD